MADLLVEKNNNIATLTFNRPEARNALSMDMRSNLRDVLAVINRLADGGHARMMEGAVTHENNLFVIDKRIDTCARSAT